MTINNDTTLTAKWFKASPEDPDPTVYTVTFEPNGGSVTAGKQSVIDGGVAAKPSNPSKSGYTFNGWFSDKACTKAFDFNTKITADITLYAQWKAINYKITYNAGNGATNPGTNPKTYNVETADITFAAATKTGYTFKGWFDANNKQVTGIAKGSRTGALELTAKWTKIAVSSFAIGGAKYIVQKELKNVYIKADSKKIKKLTVAKAVKDKYGNKYKVIGVAKAGFKNCKKLTKVSGGTNMTTICANAFAGCKKLKNFACTSKNLNTIGKNAFAKTKKLTKITIKKTTKLKTVKNAFKNAGKNGGKGLTVKVKSSKKNAYKKLILKKGGNKKLKVH